MAEYMAGRGTTALGIIGTALGGVAVAGQGLLGGGGILGGNNNFVSRETFDLSMALSASQRDNAILSADLASEKKMVEVFNAANDKIMAVRDEVNARMYNLETTVSSNAAAQAVINCGFNSNIGILQTQVGQLMGMTKLGIPEANIITASTTTTTA